MVTYNQGTYQYTSNFTMCYKINPDGSMMWMKNLNKSVIAYIKGYTSQLVFIQNGSVRVIFNDTKRNYDESGNYISAENAKKNGLLYDKQTNLAIITIDLETGTDKRRMLQSAENNGALVNFNKKLLDNDLIILEGFKRNKFEMKLGVINNTYLDKL